MTDELCIWGTVGYKRVSMAEYVVLPFYCYEAAKYFVATSWWEILIL